MSRLVAAMRASATEVRACADELNRLDAQAGDGDLGVTMTIAADTVIAELDAMPAAEPAAVLKQCGLAVARAAPSTSGTLVATALLRASQAATSSGESPARELARSLDAAASGVAERGGATVGAKTMLDALVPAAAACGAAADRDQDVAGALAAAAEAAELGARATVEMTPRHGRAGWLAERSAGHEDGGARLVAVVLAAAASECARDAARG